MRPVRFHNPGSLRQPLTVLVRYGERRLTFVSRSPQHVAVSTYTRLSATARLRNAIARAKNENPILLPVLLVGCVGSVSLLGLMVYDQYTNVNPQYAAYPHPVEQRLRLALHYTHIQPDPEIAAKHFAEAIKAAEECEMDPFSKEFMGIRIRYSEMLEKFGYVKAAVDILNEVTKECEAKLAAVDKKGSTPTADDANAAPITRKALLRSIIEIKVKASTLYESDYIQNPTLAKQTLSDAVSLLVKETKDPQRNGFTDDNAAGLSVAEIASILSQMGDLYATSGEEANAVQVYMLALQPLRAACDGTRSCKEVQVLSNIASTMDIAMKKPKAKINGKPATKESLAAARRATLKWAEQAIATAELVPPETRDETCELGLLSAQMARADLLLDTGEKQISKEAFTSLLPTLREKGLSQLAEVAEQGLKKAGG